MIKGINHIGAVVLNLSETVAFYQGAAELPHVHSFALADSPDSQRIMGLQDMSCRAAVLAAKTTYLELFEFESPVLPAQIMPVNGPGITHICFQSPVDDPAFARFARQGMKPVSRGDRPVPLSSRGITYAYARDPAGLMFEMEQWDEPPRPFPLWIAHVALVSPDIQRLTDFYSRVILGLPADPDIRRVKGIDNLDVVADLDAVDLLGTWIPAGNILIEIWQFLNPQTPDRPVQNSLATPGYTHICFEVEDIGSEYDRLNDLGVPFLAAPYEAGDRAIAFGRDPDGNIFELLQFMTEAAPFSLDRLDFAR